MGDTSSLPQRGHLYPSLFKVRQLRYAVYLLLILSIQGSSILWYSSKDPKGGVASVYVDQENLEIIDASVGTDTDDNPILEVLFSRSNLDPSKEHTFNISYVGPGALGGPYVTIFLLA